MPRPPSSDAGDPAVDLATTAPVAPSSTRTLVAARFIHLCPISSCSPPQQCSGRSPLPNLAVQRCSTKTFSTSATGVVTAPISVGAPIPRDARPPGLWLVQLPAPMRLLRPPTTTVAQSNLVLYYRLCVMCAIVRATCICHLGCRQSILSERSMGCSHKKNS